MAGSEEISRKIALEAKRTIELITSKIPKVLDWREKSRYTGDVERLVVLSDTHFGDPYELLTEEANISRLCEVLKALGRIDELVLLGDVFDFWLVPLREALERGRDLIAALYELENISRMIYIPGNHDHRAFWMLYEEKYLERLRGGELDPPEISLPMTDDCPVMDILKPSSARVPLSMVYPIHQVKVRGKAVLLTHGHLLGFFERSIWRPRHSVLASLILSRSESLGLEDMERFLSPFYQMLALSAEVPGVTSGGYRLYRLLSRTGKLLGLQGDERVSTYRGTTIEENAAEIEALLNYFCPENPEYFVYGHTHRPGKFELPISKTLAINTGCWLGDEGLFDTCCTLLEIADSANLFEVDLTG